MATAVWPVSGVPAVEVVEEPSMRSEGEEKKSGRREGKGRGKRRERLSLGRRERGRRRKRRERERDEPEYIVLKVAYCF